MPISEFEWYKNIEIPQVFEQNISSRGLLKSLQENHFDSILGKKTNQISILPKINNNKVEYKFPNLEEDNLLFGECSLEFLDDNCKAIPIELNLVIGGSRLFQILGKNMYLALQEIFEMSGLPIHLLKIGMNYMQYQYIVITLEFDNQDISANDYPTLNCNIHQCNSITQHISNNSIVRSVYQSNNSFHYITDPTKQVVFWNFFYCPLILVKASQQPTSILFNNKIRLKLPRILKYIGYYVISTTKDTIFNLKNIKNTINFSQMHDILLEFEKPLENETVEIILLNWNLLIEYDGMCGFRYST